MKKIFAFTLVVVMLFALAACGSDKNKNSGSLFGNGGNTNNGGSSVVAAPLSRGFIIGDTYTNTYADITFNKPSSWAYYSDDELATLMGTTSEKMSLDLEEILDSTGSFYDMMAVDSATGTNVIVMFENLAASNSVGISASDYIDNVFAMLSAAGYSFGEEKTVYIGGQSYCSAMASTTQYGVAMNQVYYIRIIGNYAVGIISTLIDTSPETVEAMFS